MLFVVRTLGLFVLALIAKTPLGENPSVMGMLGCGVLVATVGSAFAVHRAIVRCPACDSWLVPVGVNGTTPTKCPDCGVALR